MPAQAPRARRRRGPPARRRGPPGRGADGGPAAWALSRAAGTATAHGVQGRRLAVAPAADACFGAGAWRGAAWRAYVSGAADEHRAAPRCYAQALERGADG